MCVANKVSIVFIMLVVVSVSTVIAAILFISPPSDFFTTFYTFSFHKNLFYASGEKYKDKKNFFINLIFKEIGF